MASSLTTTARNRGTSRTARPSAFGQRSTDAIFASQRALPLARMVLFLVLTPLSLASFARAQDDQGTAPEGTAPEGTAAAESGQAETRGSDPREVLDLPDLLKAAHENYPGIRAAKEKIRAAEARLFEARYRPYTQFAVTGTFTVAPEATGTPIFSPDSELPLTNAYRPVMGIGIEGVIPLYTFGKIDAARSAAKAGVQAAEGDAERVAWRLRLNTQRAYFGLQFSLDVIQMLNEGQGQIEKAQDQLEAKLEEGAEGVNENDRYRLATVIAELRARRSEADRLEASSRHALHMLVGRESIQVPDCPLEPRALTLPDLHALKARALAQRPEVQMLNAGVKAREANRDAQNAGYLPDILLGVRAATSYGPGVTDQDNPFIQDRANYDSLGAGLIMRWSLDGAGTYAKAERADAELAATRAEVREAESGIALEVSAAYEKLADALRREVAWKDGHREGRAWFVSAGQAYDIGALEPKELIDAVKAYFTARTMHLQSILDVNLAAAELDRAIGGGLMPQDAWRTACE